MVYLLWPEWIPGNYSRAFEFGKCYRGSTINVALILIKNRHNKKAQPFLIALSCSEARDRT